MADSLAVFYRTLGQSLGAGLTALRALELSAAPAGTRDHLLASLRSGSSWEDALAGAPRWLPKHHRPIIAAAARSGRLSETLLKLSDQAEARSRRLRQVIAASLYPVLLIHLVPIAANTSLLVNASPGRFVFAVLASLVPLWIVIGLGILAVKLAPVAAYQLASFLPGVRGYILHGQRALCAQLLEAQLAAGVSIENAWETVARTLRIPGMRSVARLAAETARNGSPPAPQLASGPFAGEWCQLYAAGEISGQLEANLQRLAASFEDKSLRALARAAVVYPMILYGMVAIYVAIAVIRAMAGYLSNLNSLMQ
jgi:type II secretory pathway component PulF